MAPNEALHELNELCREIDLVAKEKQMSKCTECGQEKPRAFKGGDIVQSRQRPDLFGVIPHEWLGAVLNQRYGPPMKGQQRVLMLTGAMQGQTIQWSESRMDVVMGVFQVRTRR